jgi:phosphatidate cytidylyltransferase
VPLSNIWVRIIVGIAFIPGIVALAWAGGIYLFGFVVLVAVVGLWEFYRMARAKNLAPNEALGLMAVIALCLDAWRNAGQGTIAILTFLVLLTASAEIFRKQAGSALLNTAATLMGVLYTGWLLSHLILLRIMPSGTPPAPEREGMGVLLLAFTIPWFCDTAAYFTGRWIGRHRLIPRVSAGKTIEGALGGVAGAIIGLLALRSWLFPFLAPQQCLLLGGFGGIVAQVGDLAESLLKRDAGVKDSSGIIPGHGGVLDRFDSVLFVAPCVYYYLTLSGLRAG